MRSAVLLAALALAACRTQPWDISDGGAPPPDFAAASDFAATSDFAAALDLAAPPDFSVAGPPDFASSPFDLGPASCLNQTCAPGQACLFIDRADCSKHECIDLPSGCLSKPSCGCLGGDPFCAMFAESQGELVVCKPAPNWLPPGTVYCWSSYQCI